MKKIISRIRNGEVDYCVIRYKITSPLAPDVCEWQWALVAIDEDGISELRRRRARERHEFKGAASVPLFTKDIERREALCYIEGDGMSQVVKNVHGEVWEMPGQPFKRLHDRVRSQMIEEDLMRC